MKAFWRILKLVAALASGFAAVAVHLDELIKFLTFFAENKHTEGWAWLIASPHVKPLYEALTPEKKLACDLVGPLVLEWIDKALPEEPILVFLNKIKSALD